MNATEESASVQYRNRRRHQTGCREQPHRHTKITISDYHVPIYLHSASVDYHMRFSIHYGHFLRFLSVIWPLVLLKFFVNDM